MKILLFGVSNVGKTTTGELLAERLRFKFYDLDEEVKSCLGMTLEKSVSTGVGSSSSSSPQLAKPKLRAEAMKSIDKNFNVFIFFFFL